MGVRGAISQKRRLEILQNSPQIRAFRIPLHVELTEFMEIFLSFYRPVPRELIPLSCQMLVRFLKEFTKN